VKSYTLSELRNLDIDIFLSKKLLIHLLRRAGYLVDETGILLDRNGRPVKSALGEEINVKKTDDLKVVLGSHTFVRNVAELTKVLVDKRVAGLVRR